MATNFKRVGNVIKEVRPGICFDTREEYETDDIVIREIWEENVYEVNEGRFNLGGVVVDIGANIGSFSVYAAQYGAKVYAIEPEPHNIIALKRNVFLNSMEDLIVVSEVGISDFVGTAQISNMGGGASIKDETTDGSFIHVITFDNYIENHNIESIDILKIDVEGSEKEIISGASKESMNKCKYITMEFDIRSGKYLGDMVKKLSETHHVRTMGSWERGGMIWAWLY